MKKQTEAFYNSLKEKGSLNYLNILATIENSDFSKEVKDDLKERLEQHKDCSTTDEECIEEYDIELPQFVLAYYGSSIDIYLECEGCYSIIIDSEILDQMI